MAMDAGATADRISFGNTIKKERDIARAYELGIRLFAVDCVEEVEKIARAAPGARVFCRVLTDGEGAEWPLSRKFGCVPAMAVDVLRHARKLGLDAYGVSFHVGSQQCDLTAWDRALGDAKQVFATLGRGRHRAEDGQHGRWLPDALPARRAGGAGLWPGDLLGAAQAFRQPHPRDHHRARPRHGRQCRRHQVGSRADLEEVRQRQCALGFPRHRQVRRSGRDHGRGDPLPDRHRA